MHSKMAHDGDRQLSTTAAASGKRRTSGMRTYSKHVNINQDRSSSKRQRTKEDSERDYALLTTKSTSSSVRDSKPLTFNTAGPHLHHTRGANDQTPSTNRRFKEHIDGSSPGPATLSPQLPVNAEGACYYHFEVPYSNRTRHTSNRSSTEESIDNDHHHFTMPLPQQPVQSKREHNPDLVEPHTSHAKAANKRDWDARMPLEELLGNGCYDKAVMSLPRPLKSQANIYSRTATPQARQSRHTTERFSNQRRHIKMASESSLPASAKATSLQLLRKATKGVEHITAQFSPDEARPEKETARRNSSPIGVTRSTIRNYFKPIRQSSDPQANQAALQSSDPTDSSTNTPPPSSPPQSQVIPVSLNERSKKRLPRRLTARPALLKSETMDYNGVLMGHESVYVPTILKTEECCSSGGIANLMNRSTRTAGDYKVLTQLPDLPSSNILPFYMPPTVTTSKSTSRSSLSRDTVFRSAPAPINITPAKPQKKSFKPRGPLYQAQLDLGQAYHKVCQKCQMPYNSALSTDREIHDKQCYKYDLPRLANEEIEFSQNFVSIRNIHGTSHKTMVVDCTSDLHLKHLALKVIDFTYKEMGGMVYSPNELWEKIKEPRDQKGRHEACRYKVYIRYINKAVAGLLVAERYVNNMAVQIDGIPRGEKFVVIDRIWVKDDCRGQGVAGDLVDEMRKDFVPGMRLDKEHLTTSQLTDSHGKGWAKMYFGEC